VPKHCSAITGSQHSLANVHNSGFPPADATINETLRQTLIHLDGNVYERTSDMPRRRQVSLPLSSSSLALIGFLIPTHACCDTHTLRRLLFPLTHKHTTCASPTACYTICRCCCHPTHTHRDRSCALPQYIPSSQTILLSFCRAQRPPTSTPSRASLSIRTASVPTLLESKQQELAVYAQYV